MKVRIVGDSNTAALKFAFDDLVERGEWPQSVELEFGATNGGQWRRNSFFEEDANCLRVTIPEFEDILGFGSLQSGSPPEIVYGLCLNYHTVRVWRDRQWSTYAPLGLEKDEFPVSWNVLKRIVLDDQPQVLRFASALARLGVKVFAIEAPQPFASHVAIRKGRIRPDIVLAVDRFYRSFIRGELDRASVPTLPVPRDCIGSDGFMKDEFKSERDKDQHHANPEFGKLMLRQMVPFIEQEFGGSPRGRQVRPRAGFQSADGDVVA